MFTTHCEVDERMVAEFQRAQVLVGYQYMDVSVKDIKVIKDIEDL